MLNVFNFLTLNGFYKGPDGDISWNRHNSEEQEHAEDSVGEAQHILLFGRVTYQMMAGYWPSPMAMQNSPVVAKGMNRSEKIVFSRTLKQAEWQNTRVISDNLIEEIKALKAMPNKHLTVLGSGSIVSQLADAGLIDAYQLMVNPVALGSGTPIFSGIQHPLQLALRSVKSFKSGVVMLDYVPVN